MNLDLNALKYLNWNKIKTNLSWKVKKCKDRLTQIYWILNKVQKTLNSIKEIEISHFKKSWGQEIKHLAKIQTEFAKSETREMINTHYRKLERIIKKAKNIVMYINASQIRKKIAEVETETETTVIFTHELIRFSKATSVSDKIITTKAKLQVISDAIAICSEKALKNSEIWVYINSQMTLQRATSMWSYSMTYDKTWPIYVRISVKFTYSEYRVAKALLKTKNRSIDQKRCSRTISYWQHESNHHKLRQKANLQRGEITMIKCMKKQHQEGKTVSKAHIEREFKSEITKRA